MQCAFSPHAALPFHTAAHVELAENWKGEALRLAEVNKQAGAKETLDKLKQLSTENAELKRLIARAELRGANHAVLARRSIDTTTSSTHQNQLC